MSAWVRLAPYMKENVLRTKAFQLLSLVPYAMVLCSCATTSQPATPVYCPRPQSAPSNVMRPPSYERRLRELLFKSAPTQTPSSKPAKR